MRKMLPIVASGLGLLINAAPSAETTNDCQPGEISNRPECIAAEVYVGDDKDMPLSEGFKLSLPKVSKQNIPTSVQESVLAAAGVLPHWYLIGLRNSRGDSKCDVLVNGISYSAIVVNWFWAEWGMSDKTSALRRAFEGEGYKSQSDILQAMNRKICEYSKGSPN